MTRGPGRSRRPGLSDLAGPLYFVALLLVALPLVDLATNVWPFRLDEMSWRYGTVGLLSGFLLTPLLGLVMAVVIAWASGHASMLKALGVLSALTALVVLGVTGLFILDVVQIGAEVPPEGQSAYRVGTLRAMLKNMLVAGSLAWLAAGALRAAKG